MMPVGMNNDAELVSASLSGKREAHLTALGVISGIYKPDGIVGDLGGGSLELVDVHGSRVRGGVTLPLGGLKSGAKKKAKNEKKRLKKLAKRQAAAEEGNGLFGL